MRLRGAARRHLEPTARHIESSFQVLRWGRGRDGRPSLPSSRWTHRSQRSVRPENAVDRRDRLLQVTEGDRRTRLKVVKIAKSHPAKATSMQLKSRVAAPGAEPIPFKNSPAPERQPGAWKGKVWIRRDFDKLHPNSNRLST